MVLILLLACFSTPARVCESQVQAQSTCDWLTADEACEDNLSGCSGDDLIAWNAWFQCLADACADGVPQADVGETCTGLLDGVSWGCSPSGALE